MKIKEVYEKYSVTPNLAEHMMRVARVVEFIRDHWIGPKVDWDVIVESALLHDVGNIVKFDFDKYPELLGDQRVRLNYWKDRQAEMTSRYGSDDHKVTEKLLAEIGVRGEVYETVERGGFQKIIAIGHSDFWQTKILVYSDLRVMPTGVVSLEDRLTYIRDRYPKYSSRPDYPEMENACREIEKQIGENIDVPVSQISDAVLPKGDEELISLTV